MCGIFAYHGTQSPTPEQLVAAALGAGQRGPHGHGWVTSTRPGDLDAHYRIGPLADHIDQVAAITATTVLGHARLATTPNWNDIGALQPVVANGHALAHNGHAYNADRLDPGDAPSDSYALARLYARLRHSLDPATALDKLTAEAVQRAWVIVVLDADGTLYAHRRYHPLYLWDDPRGTYLSSKSSHPRAWLIPEEQPLVLTGGAVGGR